MPVQVGEIVSTVTTEPDAGSGGQSAGSHEEWQRAAVTREMLKRLRLDHWRTAAESFDD